MRNPIVEKFIKNLFGGGCENTALVGVPCNSIRELCDKIAPPPEHVPHGWEWTGEVRLARRGEWVLDYNDIYGWVSGLSIGDSKYLPMFILRRVETLHTFDEAMTAYAKGAEVRRKNWVRCIGMETRNLLRVDVTATDWLIEEEK